MIAHYDKQKLTRAGALHERTTRLVASDLNGNTEVHTRTFNVYETSTTANVISTAGNAELTVADPGHLTNGAFQLPQPLQVEPTPAAWTGPVSNAIATIAFKQAIGANDALRTGTYSRTLTFTLSTTTP